MKTTANTIITVVIGFILTLTMNSTIEYFGQNKGSIVIGPAIVVGGRQYQPVDIVNHSADFFNDMILSVPSGTNASEIVANIPLEIETVASTVGIDSSKNLRVSGIRPAQVTRLLIPLEVGDAGRQIVLVNAKRLGIQIEPTTDIPSALSVAARRALLDAVVYAVVLGVFSYWAYSHQSHLENETKVLKREVQEAQEQVEQVTRAVEQKSKETQKAVTRVKLYLLARLSDYAKELNFWRDTVRKMLYHAQRSEKGFTADELFDLVTENLKTYGTKSSADEYKTIEFMAARLTGNDK